MKILCLSIGISLCLFSAGCDSWFQWGEKIELGLLNNIENGVCIIPVELKPPINAWHVMIGGPLVYEEVKDKIDKQTWEKILTVSIINKNDIELGIRKVDFGRLYIPPGVEKIWYKGSLLELISKTRPIQTEFSNGNICKYDVKIKFEDKDIQIEPPVKITASWYESL